MLSKKWMAWVLPAAFIGMTYTHGVDAQTQQEQTSVRHQCPGDENVRHQCPGDENVRHQCPDDQQVRHQCPGDD